MRASTRRSRLDREVRELLREDPELLALAEVIASLRPEDIHGVDSNRRWRHFPVGRALLAIVGRRPT